MWFSLSVYVLKLFLNGIQKHSGGATLTASLKTYKLVVNRQIMSTKIKWIQIMVQKVRVWDESL